MQPCGCCCAWPVAAARRARSRCPQARPRLPRRRPHDEPARRALPGATRRRPSARRLLARRAGARVRHAAVCVFAARDARCRGRLPARAGGPAASAVLRDEGQPQPGRAADLRAGRLRLRHRLGGRAGARAGRGRQCLQGGLLRRRQDPRRDAPRAAGRRALLQRGKPGRAGAAVAAGGGRGPHGAGEPARQPRRGRRHAPLHFHRPEGQQVRHRARPGGGQLPPRRQPAGAAGGGHRLPHRLADHAGGTLSRRAGPPARPGRGGGSRGHPHPPCRRRRRPGHPVRRRKPHPRPTNW